MYKYLQAIRSINQYIYYTALRNHNRIAFEEMSSWTALTMHHRNKANIFDQIYKEQIYSESYNDDFWLS